MTVRSAAIQAASLLAVACAATFPAAAADVQSRLHENWQAEIARTPQPSEGCFTATYPSKVWSKVACKKAPARPYIPRGLVHTAGGFTVGNGNDYAAVAHGRITTANGTFPVVTGLKSETDGGANIYSLQLNSNFFSTAVCNGSSDPGNCLGWEQFVYSSSSGASFIQYWLINYGNSCPTTPYNDWNNYQGSCYRNSNAVGVPLQAITQLPHLKITGTATATKDTFVTTTANNAYSTGGNDNVVKLATGWAANEFNVVGDGGGSEASFNTGTSLTVRLTQKDGTTTAPTCNGNDGTTGETNNLTLGSCSAKSGAAGYIQFTEKR
jgi:hypothetical protein